MIVYRDSGSAMGMGRLRNVSLHVLYTSLFSFYVNYSLHTPVLSCAQLFSSTALAITMSTHLPSLLYTVNINLFGIVYSVVHGVLLIINVV